MESARWMPVCLARCPWGIWVTSVWWGQIFRNKWQNGLYRAHSIMEWFSWIYIKVKAYWFDFLLFIAIKSAQHRNATFPSQSSTFQWHSNGIPCHNGLYLACLITLWFSWFAQWACGLGYYPLTHAHTTDFVLFTQGMELRIIFALLPGIMGFF
jgi:hypothetical protein